MNSDLTITRVLKSFIVATSWEIILNQLLAWGINKESRYVCHCNVHSISTAFRNDLYQRIINDADMATPDGMPIVWLLRKRGFPKQARINGPDLMLRLCREAAQKGISVFFYGSTQHTLKKLEAHLKDRYPNLKIAGLYSPPFRPLTPEEDRKISMQINSSGAGFVFVGLGCPKQEMWMYRHRGKIRAVMLGVGAAFDFHAGTVNRAPKWMQEHGLEWFYRLTQEPRRMWWRYAKTNSIFAWMVLKEILKSNAGSK